MGVFWLWWAIVASGTLAGATFAARRGAGWVAWALGVGGALGIASAMFVAWGEFGWAWSGPSLEFADQSAEQAFSAVHRLLWTWDSLLYFPIVLLQLPMAVGRDLVNWVVGLLLWPFYAAAWPGAAIGMSLGGRPLLAWVAWFVQGAMGGAALVVPLAGFIRSIDPGAQRG